MAKLTQLLAIVLATLCLATHRDAAAQQRRLGGRVIWAASDRVYLAPADSGALEPGTLLRFRDHGKEVAVGRVTGVHDGTIVAARITSGSLARKKLDRLEVTAEPPLLAGRPLLKAGYPSPKRGHPLLACREMVLSALAPYRADTLGERSFRLVLDLPPAERAPSPDTILVRLFDEVADEEIALERGELDVAVFWPGEASTHIRDTMQWSGRPILKTRGVLAITSPTTLPGQIPLRLGFADLQLLDSLNQELFRGDLVPLTRDAWSAMMDSTAPSTRTATVRFEVDSSCTRHDALERFLNRARRPLPGIARGVRVACMDTLGVPGAGSPGWIFGAACPVISKPELRPYVTWAAVKGLLQLFDCRTAVRKP